MSDHVLLTMFAEQREQIERAGIFLKLLEAKTRCSDDGNPWAIDVDFTREGDQTKYCATFQNNGINSLYRVKGRLHELADHLPFSEQQTLIGAVHASFPMCFSVLKPTLRPGEDPASRLDALRDKLNAFAMFGMPLRVNFKDSVQLTGMRKPATSAICRFFLSEQGNVCITAAKRSGQDVSRLFDKIYSIN